MVFTNEELNGILDAWRYNNMFDWDLSIHPFFNGEKTVPAKNCEAIEKRLCEKGFKANVYRHTLFGVRYYLANNLKDKNKFDDEDIARILDIPNDWICLYNYNGMKSTYAILEDELNEKYGDCNGELHFKKDCPFDLVKTLRAKGTDEVGKHLAENDLECQLVWVIKAKLLLIRDDNWWGSIKYAEVLNIPSNSITDISCEQISNLKFIVDLTKVEGD